MNGSAIGTLNVDVSTDCSVWTNVWTLSGSQGDVWTQATVDLTAYAGTTIKVRFVGVRGSSWSGDITIDDVALDVDAGCTTNGDCDDADACTTDTCIAGLCQNTPMNCDDGLFCNGVEVCNAGTCEGAPSGGVTNGTFDGSGSWTNNIPSDGTITYGGNLNVVGPDGGVQAFTWASQSGVVVNGANLEFDLLSYTSSDTVDWDYPVFYLNGTFYGLNSNGTLGAATTGGTSGAGTISNDGQTASTIHFVVDIDGLAGGAGPHTIGFGVNSADGGFGAGTAVYDTVTPADASDPCPGQTCDEVNDVCIP